MKAYPMMTNKNMNCRVCGLTQVEPPWGEDGMVPTFNICPCCGVEFGRNDLSREQVQDIRTDWIKLGCPWFLSQERPTDWDLQIQLQQVPPYFQ